MMVDVATVPVFTQLYGRNTTTIYVSAFLSR
jgi:hypothetical protein